MKSLLSGMLLMLIVMPGMAQYSLSGKVTDPTGNGLPGATIILKLSGQATATDDNGNYQFQGLAEGKYVLNVSYVGYATANMTVEVNRNEVLDVSMEEDIQLKDEVIVYATRANEKTPTTYTNISQEEIIDRNLGQDMPFVLNFTPSVVTTSDAGAGVGYTGIRIRGSDPTRINVTVNGIPLNDSESHGVFWVNMPDFASSVNNIQVQRGVGTSTNGAAAFGATINLQTNTPSTEAFGQIDNSFGSFDTRKHTVMINSGLINDRWAFEGRLSQIASEGYIDRASSDLKSYYLSGAYYGDKTIIKGLVFGGKEVTYQSWNGTPEARLNNDVAGMEAVIANNGYSDEQAANLLNSGRTFNFYLYDNQVDNYNQDHYQLHLNHQFSDYFNINGAFHYTYGRGYFEEYRDDDDLSDYGLPPVIAGGDTITSTDLIRRRWLDNHFYGLTYSANYSKDKLDLTLGGGYNKYDGDHFGEIIWARFAGDTEIRDNYYFNIGEKTDFNVYLRGNYQVSPKVNVYGDLQLRTIDYSTMGNDNDLRVIDVQDNFTFFNPKFGLTYNPSSSTSLYASFSVGNREPVRGDFIDAPAGEVPEHETLRNLEVGIRKQSGKTFYNINYYLMDYKNQLVLTGEVNDVGANIRTNVAKSYRMGVEFEGGIQLSPKLQWVANLTLSQNKIQSFTELIYDYGPNFDEFNEIRRDYEDVDISFSPNVIGGSQLTFQPSVSFDIALLSKYVGQQFLDNTQDDARSIDAYFINDLKLDYRFTVKGLKHLNLSLLVNNIFDVMYESNGYTFGYAGGGSEIRENYYYPQAGTNFLAALSVRF
ncbi:MAG: TonB-dependent receptor [Bacteroidota bacterium]